MQVLLTNNLIKRWKSKLHRMSGLETNMNQNWGDQQQKGNHLKCISQMNMSTIILMKKKQKALRKPLRRMAKRIGCNPWKRKFCHWRIIKRMICWNYQKEEGVAKQMVFELKNEDNKPNPGYKARIVIKGANQKKNIDFEEKFSIMV